MASALELYDSRVSHIAATPNAVTIYFSLAYIRKSSGRGGSWWAQEAALVLHDATVATSLPPLPNTLSDGYLEVGGIRHERIPLPFKRKVDALLHLEFADGATLEIAGSKPYIELLGAPILLED